jgi:Na+-translocating ferredoxin:NAD+ oxidoreductase RNF subunit RnfB
MSIDSATDEIEKKQVCVPIQAQSIIVYDPEVCTGCKNLKEPMCVKACRNDMLFPNPEKGKPPIVAYPEECCECGCCVHACPHGLKGAITMNWSIGKLVRWKRKDTGRHCRVGMANPPEPNTRPPASGYYPKIKRG